MQQQEFTAMPDANGFFGEFGGQFVPPNLKQAMNEINLAYESIRQSDGFQQELASLFADYVGKKNKFQDKR